MRYGAICSLSSSLYDMGNLTLPVNTGCGLCRMLSLSPA